ncbi:HAMP domain-containing sensor histidine kinase [Pigmentibacter sp. JX0631]|uniref:sensor histidine kinase n=1 Tax=Pigmentibacter sp. JX0631 TaxID=2976982 RepID=UPI00246978C3|nr:HAMP domain-containing sensor histidine kinase [Pigmentibacter sp. JX0631]WGL59567.1 HAMP domain-containing sensor histidine kinase [Pigmentibacter sp. JX0631]
MDFKQFIQKVKCFLFDYSFPDEERTKLFWLIHLRWIAIFLLLILLYFVIKFEWIQPQFILLYILTLLNLSILNMGAFFLAHKLKIISINFVFFQLTSDLCAITFLLVITGGIWNPLVQIIYLNIILGAILLHKVQAIIFFISSLLCILFLHYSNFTPPAFSLYPNKNSLFLSGQLAICILIFSLTHWISRLLSKQKKYSEILLNENNRLDKLRAIGALSAGFSHEFATPLNTIKLRTERIERKSNELMQSDLETIKKAINQCESAIKQIHSKSLSDEKTFFEKKNIYELISKIIFSWKSKNNNIIFISEKEAKNLECKIPLLAFTKAFIDILENAIQANNSNTLEISVKLQVKDQYLKLSVADNGPGWPKIIKQYAGKPFLTTKEDGVGLGLYNAFSLASAVNGKFILLDNSNGGACAQFLIPIWKE